MEGEGKGEGRERKEKGNKEKYQLNSNPGHFYCMSGGWWRVPTYSKYSKLFSAFSSSPFDPVR